MRRSYMEIFNKHNEDDTCPLCHGFIENFVYNYEEMYKMYNGHLKHLFVHDYHRNGRKDMTEYNNFVKFAQNTGFFGPFAQSHLWRIYIEPSHGYLRFEKFRG